jgi:predicted ATP-binding protein involved in virulence
MKKYINKIDAILANTKKNVRIGLDGKNLIITGGNGCGKTQFLNQISQTLNILFNHQIQKNLENQKRNLKIFEQRLAQVQANDQPALIRQIDDTKIAIKQFSNQNCKLTLDNLERALEDSNQKKLLLRLFEATRQYVSPKQGLASTVDSMQKEARQQDLTHDTSQTFESYLVTYLNAGYMAFALRNDKKEKSKVDSWLENITNDLRYLFEDETLALEYKEKERVFYVNQHGKEPFKFSQLSSGYSSILKIYTDLLMKVELRGIDAKDLTGIVIIDEIDAHLHVSLQKKILAFLDNAYPNIQFIVSTHSPFVIQSVDNAVIYDLSKLEQLEDLSMYSYESITKGLLGVKATSSLLDGLISELSTLTPKFKGNEKRVKELVEQIGVHENELDSRSKVALLMGKQAILDNNS